MKKLPPFSVILVFVVLTLIGAGTLPLLNIQYTPSERGSAIEIDFAWSGASAKLIESEVTSKLEGLVASVSGIHNISSVSKQGFGTITVQLKNKQDLEVVRFEIASLIRQTYKKFPAGVSYPTLSVAASGIQAQPILTFTVHADLPTQQIENYTQEHIVKEIALLDGVNDVLLSGATPFYTQVAFDPQKMGTYRVSIPELTQALRLTLDLKGDTSPGQLEEVAVKNEEGHIIRVKDVAHVSYEEQEPTFYYRINGLNTINVTVYPQKFINTLDVCATVKARMEQLQAGFPNKFAVITSYDASVDLKEEIHKIVLRTVLSLLILLLFVLIASRSFRYLFTITVALVSNIFIAFAFYVLFDLEIHLYAMAGITVSLGIVIDTSIVMISHYGYYHNRDVFSALLGAQLTTIGALLVVFLLPEQQRSNLVDFAAVIIINLTISLLVSAFFIPALVDTVGLHSRNSSAQFSSRRRVIRINHIYAQYITLARKYRWVVLVLVALVFGGSLKLFLKNYSSLHFYREPTRPTLSIMASLPDGCTVGQLNEVVLSMENYLAQFDQIALFKTNIYSHSRAQITVHFKKEWEESAFPLQLKQEVIAKAIDFGGANWGVYGIDDQGFDNNVTSPYKGNRIELTGYNYDQLYAFCQQSMATLSHNPRVNGAEVTGNVGWGNAISRSEYHIAYNPYALASNRLSPRDAYESLQAQLFSTGVGTYYKDGVATSLQVVSQNKTQFDVWNLRNEYIQIGDETLKFTDIGSLEKRNSGNDIYKDNQQYKLIVAYDFVGSRQQSKKVMEREINRLNNEVLPIGYKADSTSWNYSRNATQYIRLLLLIVAVIYFICAILFESFTYPLLIIGLIPVSFVGVFFVFAITGSYFDQGGYASLVMLSGIVVNAGIYILNEYKSQRNRRYGSYLRAYNHKIIPILLTVLSTVLGLIPFLLDGPNEVFWFSFALGTMGGLLFSLIALVFFLPACLSSK